MTDRAEPSLSLTVTWEPTEAISPLADALRTAFWDSQPITLQIGQQPATEFLITDEARMIGSAKPTMVFQCLERPR